MKVSKQSTIHRRTKCFVEFIAPEKEKREKIKEQSEGIRKCIRDKATADGYTILAEPYSGSFAKKSGVRRDLNGDSEVKGQDIDIAFILKDEDKDGNSLGCMISTFEGYLKKCYPDSEVGSTKSSATISFSGSKNEFDAVPLIETKRKYIQKLIRTGSEDDRQSSVEKQTEFIKSRNRSSNEIDGVVRFNDCLRLIKWWRYQQQSQPGGQFGNGENDDKIPSFLLDLLCAKAYDELLLRDTYAETLARWFSYLAHIIRNREEILFNDCIKRHQEREVAKWKVIDPMDDTNNVVKNWPDYKINEFATWFERARDRMSQAIRHDREGDDQLSMDCLVQLFGNSFNNQCKEI